MRAQPARPVLLLLPICLAGLALVTLMLGVRLARAEPLATTRYVAVNGSGVGCSSLVPCRLQTAVANSNNGDTIIVAGGTYTGTGPAVISITKSITLLAGWNGSAIGDLEISPAAHPTTLDGETARRVVGITGDITPTIIGFIITRGNATGLALGCLQGSAKGCGGGVFIQNAHARIYDNRFIGNTALMTATAYGQGAGGGLYANQANYTVISGNVFLSNVATLVYQGIGGALALDSGLTITVRNNTFIANEGAPWGGAVALGSFVYAQVTDNQFTSNTASYGAALYTWYAYPTISRNLFTGNTGESTLYIGFASGLLNSNQVHDNATTIGVDIVNGFPTWLVRLVNNIVMDSGTDVVRAFGFSGGPLSVQLAHNTLVGIAGDNGVHVTSGYVTMALTNTLISGVDTGIRRDYPLSDSVAANHTLFDANVGAHGTAAESSSLDGAALLTSEGTISPGSAAEDTGAGVGVLIDFQGDVRPHGPAPDIGADEIVIRWLYAPISTR
ncbi:MAG: hypothetical protein IT317_11900 [Anaerolineales bacterium]|nr:hypothetical protein [Anaerolineales bacterium]